jgi:zinc transport system permease protein
VLEALGYDFFRHALLAGLLASLACGVVGSLVVVNRLVFLVGGVAHAAYGGVGLAFFLGISPLLGAVGFSLAAAGLMAWVALTNKARADAVVGVLWALGMALGVILVNLTPGYNPDLMAYLFG